jgi:hypothetical protein
VGGRVIERMDIAISKIKSFELGVAYQGHYPGVKKPRVAVYVVVMRGMNYEVLVSLPHKDDWLSIYHSKYVGAIVEFMNSISGDTIEKVVPYVYSI